MERLNKCIGVTLPCCKKTTGFCWRESHKLLRKSFHINRLVDISRKQNLQAA
jgi:hypothetical protein